MHSNIVAKVGYAIGLLVSSSWVVWSITHSNASYLQQLTKFTYEPDKITPINLRLSVCFVMILVHDVLMIVLS